MPVQRKQQVLAKIESSEGVTSTPGAADAILVFDPALTDTVDIIDRVPAGPTLSRDFTPIGRKTRQLVFKSDLRGNGTPATAPDWALPLTASGYYKGTIQKVTLGAVTGNLAGFQVAEQITQSAGAIKAVILGCFSSTDVLKERATVSGDYLVVAKVAGTLTAAASTGASSGALSTASAVASYTGHCYQPTSQKLINILTGAYTGTPPAIVGEVLAVEDATTAQVLGAVQIINNNSGFVDIDATLLWGAILNGNKLRSAGNGTATISSSPTQVRTPSITFWHNLDGRRRELLGGRGDWTMEGEVGQPLQFTWTFTGDIGAASDNAATATSGLSTTRPPRLLGAICCYGNGTSLVKMPTKKVSVSNGGVVNPNLDANRAGGATGSNVTDRDPSVKFTVDTVQSAFDWEALRDAGTIVRVAFLLGTVTGNICAVIVPVGQVTEVTQSDSEGIATFDVTVKPRRIQESGDDDIYLAQL